MIIGNTAKKKEEQGVTGTQIHYGYIHDEDYNPSWNTSKKYDYIEQMTFTDAQVYAVLLAHKLLLLQATIEIEPASDENVDLQIAEETEKALFNSDLFEWSSIQDHILKHWEYGFYPFEKTPIYYNNKLYFKLSPRKPKTIRRWVQTNEGQLDYIEQYAMRPNQGYETINIDNSSLVLFNIGREGSNYEGQSLLRPIWKNSYAKDILIKLDMIKHDRHAVPPPKIGLPEDEKDGDLERAELVGETYRSHEKGYVITPHGWTFDVLELKNSQGTNIIDSINFHNKEITGAFLTNFLLVGMTEAGTYNLVENKQDMFYLAIQGYAKRIEDVINERNEGRAVIKDFVDWNYKNVTKYPRFKYAKIANVDYQKLAETLDKLANKNFISPTEEIRGHLIESLGLPETQTIIETPKEKIEVVPDEKQEDESEELTDCGCGIHLQDEIDFRREMTDVEKSVLNLKEIKNELKEYQDKLVKIGNGYRKEMIDSLIKKGQTLLAKNVDLRTFKEQLDDYLINAQIKNRYLKQGKMATSLTRELKDVYRFGQNQVKQELSKQGVKLVGEKVIIEEGVKVVRPLAELTVSTLVNKLVNEFKKEVTRQKNRGLMNIERLNTILVTLSKNDFKREMLESAINMMGQGRTKEAARHNEKITKIVRSEIMDNRICDNCKKVDGLEMDGLDDPRYSEFAAGPYIQCEGADLCRGINIYVSE